MKIVQPLFIVGSGRCGSTVFHRLLARHRQLMWLSGFCDRYPTRPDWNRWAVTAMSHPPLRRLFGRRIQPGECYRFWDHYAFGFSEPCRDLRREDVTVRVKKQVRSVFESMLTPGRNRLLIKITGWPRIGFLKEIFEDAKFIHMLRDGRGVASSLLHVDFWRGWYGPQGWRAGLLSPEDQAAWESYGRSFTALAGLEWKIQVRAMEAARQGLGPDEFYQIKYESFCQHPEEVCRQVFDFAELPWSAEFAQHIRTAGVKNSDRWRNDLTLGQQAILENLLRDDLAKYGYDVARESRKEAPIGSSA